MHLRPAVKQERVEKGRSAQVLFTVAFRLALRVDQTLVQIRRDDRLSALGGRRDPIQLCFDELDQTSLVEVDFRQQPIDHVVVEDFGEHMAGIDFGMTGRDGELDGTHQDLLEFFGKLLEVHEIHLRFGTLAT